MVLEREPKVVVRVEGNVLTYDDTGVCAVVTREGTNPFRQPYECSDEAWSFFRRLVFAAYERAPHTLRTGS